MADAAGPSKLSPSTSGFALAAGIAVLFNTVLACTKDVSAPLKTFLKSIAGHDWTTQGLIDLFLFVGLGFLFMKARVGERIDPLRLIGLLVGAVVVAATALAVWYAIY